jgi:hypothetical protein
VGGGGKRFELDCQSRRQRLAMILERSGYGVESPVAPLVACARREQFEDRRGE